MSQTIELPPIVSARMIATTPRAGTWNAKYVLCSMDLLKRGKSLDAATVYKMAAAPLYDFTESFRWNPVVVDHNPVPGFASSPDAEESGWADLARKLEVLDYFLDRDKLYDNFTRAPTVFIFRHPFDLFVTYARMRADVVHYGNQPFHELMPVRHPPVIPGEDPIERFLSAYEETRFFEAYLLHFVPHWFFARKYLTTRMMTYESILRDRAGQWTKIFMSLGTFPDFKFLGPALEFTSLESMKRHEETLGHGISGPQYYWGARRDSHITKYPPLDWREVVPTAARQYAANLFGKWGLDPENLPIR